MSVCAEFWSTLDARDWDAFAALLAEDVSARWPQTREHCQGRGALVQFMREFPGDWRITLVREHVDARGGATRIDVVSGGETQSGLTFFTLDEAGRIAAIEEYWPEPYEPPDRGGTLERAGETFYNSARGASALPSQQSTYGDSPGSSVDGDGPATAIVTLASDHLPHEVRC